jgi:hypothetical protein
VLTDDRRLVGSSASVDFKISVQPDLLKLVHTAGADFDERSGCPVTGRLQSVFARRP